MSPAREEEGERGRGEREGREGRERGGGGERGGEREGGREGGERGRGEILEVKKGEYRTHYFSQKAPQHPTVPKVIMSHY